MSSDEWVSEWVSEWKDKVNYNVVSKRISDVNEKSMIKWLIEWKGEEENE